MRLPFTKPKAAPELPPTSDIETIRSKLAVVEQEIAEARSELDRCALLAVLAGDESAADATARLDGLRQRRALLSHALAAAEQAQADKLAALEARDWAARRRAASQHAARLEKLARSISEAQSVLLSDYAKMIETAAALVASLPPSMRSRAEPWHEMLAPDALQAMTILEGYRLNREGGPVLFPRPLGASEHERREDGALPSLTERIATMTALARANFDQSNRHSPPLGPAMSEPATVDAHSPAVAGYRTGESDENMEIANV